MGFPTLLFPSEIASAVELRETTKGMEIWDPIRKKWLIAVPEEWVRQHCIIYLEALGFHKSNMSTEAGVQTGFKQKRTDIVAGKDGKPIILVECKAPSVKLSQATFNQAFNYNQSVKAPYLWLTNGLQHLYWDCTKNAQCAALPLTESV